MSIEELILELSKRFFVKRISFDKISVIASYEVDLVVLPSKYPLHIAEKYKQQFTTQYDFIFIKKVD